MSISLGGRGTSLGGFLGGKNAGMERLDDIEEIAGSGGEREKTEQRSERRGRGGSGGADSVPVYEVKSGKIELRNSMNGLGQNRWS